eukprot:scaffold752_cov196-Chaetoceros_neogracile.AAC.2
MKAKMPKDDTKTQSQTRTQTQITHCNKEGFCTRAGTNGSQNKLSGEMGGTNSSSVRRYGNMYPPYPGNPPTFSRTNCRKPFNTEGPSSTLKVCDLETP